MPSAARWGPLEVLCARGVADSVNPAGPLARHVHRAEWGSAGLWSGTLRVSRSLPLNAQTTPMTGSRGMRCMMHPCPLRARTRWTADRKSPRRRRRVHVGRQSSLGHRTLCIRMPPRGPKTLRPFTRSVRHPSRPILTLELHHRSSTHPSRRRPHPLVLYPPFPRLQGMNASPPRRPNTTSSPLSFPNVPTTSPVHPLCPPTACASRTTHLRRHRRRPCLLFPPRTIYWGTRARRT